MKTKNIISSLVLTLAIIGLAVGAAIARVPWGTIQQVTGATPSPTSFTSAPVIIDLMTGNTTMGSFSGGSAGAYFTVILEQDGTGARTVAWPTNATGGWPTTFPAAVTTANGYTVLVGQVGTVTTAYNFIQEYDNVALNDSFIGALNSAGTTIAPNATQAQTAQYAPGVTAASGCSCLPATYPATWQVGIFTECVPTTNTVTCQVVNPDPTNTHTPAAVSLNIRLSNP